MPLSEAPRGARAPAFAYSSPLLISLCTLPPPRPHTRTQGILASPSLNNKVNSNPPPGTLG